MVYKCYILTFLKKKKDYIFLFSWKAERVLSHLLVHSTNAFKSRDGGRPMPGAKNIIWIFHVQGPNSLSYHPLHSKMGTNGMPESGAQQGSNLGTHSVPFQVSSQLPCWTPALLPIFEISYLVLSPRHSKQVTDAAEWWNLLDNYYTGW